VTTLPAGNSEAIVAQLTNHCPKCGAENPPAKRFCGDCGIVLTVANLIATVAASSSSLPAILVSAEQTASAIADRERKTGTALFADIKGSTELLHMLRNRNRIRNQQVVGSNRRVAPERFRTNKRPIAFRKFRARRREQAEYTQHRR
jgi:hypothetical protein